MNTLTKNPNNNDKGSISYIYNTLALIVLIAGIVLYYTLKISLWLKWLIVLVAVMLAVGAFYFLSPTGIKLHSYVRDSWKELSKVVWPTRKETMQFTWIVFLFVVVLGLFLWLVDTSLSWLFYQVILGRGN